MVMLKAGGRRRPGFIIAEKSMHRPVIGDFARMLNSVPVVRPQDKAKAGSGTIQSIDAQGLKITGQDTRFNSEAQPGALISIKGVGKFAVKEVLSDTEVSIKPLADDVTLDEFSAGSAYKVVPKISQDEVFQEVYNRLCNGGCIGIFPEGGSHDQTDLLPLKAGVTLMALGAAERGAKVKICAVGINYFSGHVFRSNAFVDCSKPIEISDELLEKFKNGGKREACAELLETIRASLRSVTMHAEDYETLKAVRTARRMYQNNVSLSSTEFIKLNNRFMNANDVWQEKKDPEYMRLLDDIKSYLKFCWAQGLTDKQVRDLPPLGKCSTLMYAWWNILVTMFVLLIALPFALPGLILNLPIIWRVNRIVKKEMAKALAGSSVKLAARDVAASQKVIAGASTIVGLLLFYTVLTIVLLFVLGPDVNVSDDEWYKFPAENYYWLAGIAFLIFFPFYTFYLVVKVGESVNTRLRDLKIHTVSAFSICRSNKKNPAEVLRIDRKRLVLRVQEFIESRIEELPGWSDDRVIGKEQIVQRRSLHTKKLLEAGDLTPQLSQTSSSVSMHMSSQSD